MDAATSPASEQVQHRARLREYYKLKGTKNAEAGADKVDKGDIDQAAFDVKDFTARSGSAKLPALLKNTNELISDLKVFESSKKSLIYNNYASLIGASDTIGRMRVELDGLEKELDALDGIVKDIAEDLEAIKADSTDP